MPAVLSHETAAHLWGMDLLAAPAQTHVTVPRGSSRYRRPGTVVHRLTLARADVTSLDGEPVTTPERTIGDLARRLPLPEAVALADSAMRLSLVRRSDLERLAGSLRGRGAATAGRALRLVDPRSASMLESLCRVLLISAGLTPPATQYEVRRRGTS